MDNASASGRDAKDGRQLLGRGPALESHREPLRVVARLPRTEGARGFGEGAEGGAAPELLVVDAVAAFDFAVLLGAPRLDVPVSEAGELDGQHKVEREFGAVIGLHLLDREGQYLAELGEEVDTGARIEPGEETQDAIAGAVVAGRVLVGLRPVDGHHLDVDLDGLARRRLLEQFELPGRPPRRFGALGAGQAEIHADPRDGLGGHLDLVDPEKPEARAAGAPAELAARRLDEADGLRGDPAGAALGISGD